MKPFEISFFRSRWLSRDDAFADQGVTLAYPGRSLGGVRADDGTVVIAIPEADVMTCAAGSRCLLWTPAAGGKLPGAVLQERLAHCRLALRHGTAEGLLVSRDRAEVRRDQVLSLRVERRGGEFWALWGSPAMAPGMPGIDFPAPLAFARLAA